MSIPKPTFSIITATYNAEQVLPQLIASLQAQTDQDFEWIVADGASTDGTLALLEAAKATLGCVVVDSRPDFGIYDALNRGVKLANGEYYLVMGADDVLAADAVLSFQKAICESKADLISASVKIHDKIVDKKFPGWIWLYGASARISSHSVGLCIRTEIHKNFGFYDKTFRIYADSYFMLKALSGGATLSNEFFLAGEFCTNGISNNNQLESYCEQFRALVECGSNIYLQLFLLTLRVIKFRLTSSTESSHCKITA